MYFTHIFSGNEDVQKSTSAFRNKNLKAYLNTLISLLAARALKAHLYNV